MSEVAVVRNLNKLDVKSITSVLSLGIIDQELKKKILETLDLPTDFWMQSLPEEERATILYNAIQKKYAKLVKTEDDIPSKEEVTQSDSVIFNPFPVHTNTWYLVETIKKLSEKRPEDDPFVPITEIKEAYEAQGLKIFKPTMKALIKNLGEYDDDGKPIKASPYPMFTKHFIYDTDENGTPIAWAYAAETE